MGEKKEDLYISRKRYLYYNANVNEVYLAFRYLSIDNNYGIGIAKQFVDPDEIMPGKEYHVIRENF